MEISSENKKLFVVFDVGAKGTRNDLFDRKIAEVKHKYNPNMFAPVLLYEACLKRGIQLLTPDLYFAMNPKPANAILLKDSLIDNSFTDRLIRSGIRPAVLFGFEQPLYVCEFYFHLKRNTHIYDHVFMPKGAAPRVSKKAVFHPWISPQVVMENKTIAPRFSDRKFLSMINGNARIHFLKRVYAGLFSVMRQFPSLVNRELYVDRLEAIKFFSNDPGFDLFGRGWDAPVRYTRSYDESIKKSYRGEIDDKIGKLREYKFCLIFENCIFDGWVTEKIIDAMSAGCVPVYWGAPDIADYIPENCFIDFRKFKDFEDLSRFLKSMDEKTFDRYSENMKNFFASDMYYTHFSPEKFTKDMIQIFESYI